MKKIDLGQTIAIFANIGVIAGIVFLGFELRQNNSLLETQTRSNFMGTRFQVNNLITESPWLAEIFVKVRAGETLMPAEEVRLQAHHQNILTLWQWMYEDYTALGLEPPSGRVRAVFQEQALTPRIADTWDTYKQSAPAEFVEWMHEIVDK